MVRRSGCDRRHVAIVLLAALALGDRAAALGPGPATFLDLAELGESVIVWRPTRRLDLAAKESVGRIGPGWGPAEEWGGTGVKARWIEGGEASVTLTSITPRARRIRFLASPFTWDEAPGPQQLEVWLGARRLGMVALRSGHWTWQSVEAPADAFVFGDNQLRFRTAWSKSPKELGGDDPRQLSAAVSVLELEDRVHGNLSRRDPEPPPPELASGPDRVRLEGEGALVYYLRVPPRGRLSLLLAKDPSAARGDGFSATVRVETDGAEPRILLQRAFPGLTAGSSTRHDIDLTPFSGRAVRLTLAVACGDANSERGDSLVVDEPRVTVPTLDDSMRRLRLTAGPRFVMPEAARAAPEPERPNVILYLMDALRASDLSCYGQAHPTSPHLDRLARAGVVLASNFSQAPNTPPSVKAIFTGRYLPVIGHHTLPDDATTIAEVFATLGSYRTGAFSSSPFVSPSSGTHQGFQVLDPGLYVRGEAYAAAPPPKDYAERLAAAFGAWLDATPGADAPFFAYFHAIHPHNPYTPLPPFDHLFTVPGAGGRYDGTTTTLLAVEHGRIPLDVEAVGGYHRLLYDEDIAYTDWVIGRTLRDLRRRGELARTVFALIADHGEEFLEHGGVLHGYTAFDEMLQVPVILAGTARVPEGVTVRGLTQSIDLPATLLDAASLPAPPDMQGRTLLPLMAGRDQPQPEVYASASSVGGIYSLRSERFKYVFAPRGSGEYGGRQQGVGSSIGRKLELRYLYDLDADPRELENLADERPILAGLLHQRVMSWFESVERQGEVGQGEDIDPCMSLEECLQLVQLGYVQAGQCLCSCERFRDVWQQAADGTLAGRDAKLFAHQLECCADCKGEYEAWRAQRGVAGVEADGEETSRRSE